MKKDAISTIRSLAKQAKTEHKENLKKQSK